MEQPKRTYSRVDYQAVYRDCLQGRFDRLRDVIFQWERQIENMPRSVLALFEQEDLPGIHALMKEQKVLTARICGLKEFISKWETPVSGFVEVSRFRDE